MGANETFLTAGVGLPVCSATRWRRRERDWVGNRDTTLVSSSIGCAPARNFAVHWHERSGPRITILRHFR